MKVGSHIAARLLGILGVVIAMLTPLAVLPAPTYADSTIGVFAYDETQKDHLQSDIQNNTKPDTSFFTSSVGVWISDPNGGGPISLGYSPDRTQAIHSGNYSYGLSYDCTSSGISQTDLTPSTPHWTISYIVDQDLSTNFDSDKQISGNAYYNHIVTFPSQTDLGSSSGGPISFGPRTGGNVHVGGMTIPASCFPYTTGSIKTDNFKNMSTSDQAKWPQAASMANLAAASSSTSSDVNECGSISFGLGWFLCPVIELANNTIGSLFHDIVINSLKTEPLDAGDGGYGTSLYQVWQNVRTIADVGFVLIFLVIVFANLLGFELDAYAIKTMIPKLVAAAVLVQFSFVICAAVLDVGNVLGQGVASLLYVAAGHGTGLGGGEVFDNIIGVIEVTLLAIVAIAATNGLVLIPIVIVAIAAVLGTLAVVFTLIVRKIIIAVIVVFSPLAFVAFVLPATTRLFRVWMQNFIRVVMMYPIIAALFAMSAVLASVTSHTSSSDVSFANIQQLIAASFPIICFFLIPMTFRWAGGVMNMAYGEFSKLSSRGSKAAASSIRGSRLAENLQKSRQERREARFNAANRGDRGRFAQWWAGTRTRGAVWGQDGQGRDVRLQRRGLRFRRAYDENDARNQAMERRQLEQEHHALQHETATNMELRRRAAHQEEMKVLMEPLSGQLKADLHNQLQVIADRGLRGEATHRDQMMATAIGMHLSKEGAADGETLGLLRDVFHGDGAQADEHFLAAAREVRQANFGNFQKRLIPYFGAMGGDGADLLTIQRDGTMTVANEGPTVGGLAGLSADDLLGMDVDGRRALGQLRTEDGRTAADIIPDEIKRRMLSPTYAGRIKRQMSEILGLEEFARREGIPFGGGTADEGGDGGPTGGPTGGGGPRGGGGGPAGPAGAGGGGSWAGGGTWTPPRGSSSTGGVVSGDPGDLGPEGR